MYDEPYINEEKTLDIQEKLNKFFLPKKQDIIQTIKMIYCFDHKLEQYTLSDEPIGRYGIVHGTLLCPKIFDNWQYIYSLHWNAKLKCGKTWQCGFYLRFRAGDIDAILDKMKTMQLHQLFKPITTFDEKSELRFGTITGNSLHGY